MKRRLLASVEVPLHIVHGRVQHGLQANGLCGAETRDDRDVTTVLLSKDVPNVLSEQLGQQPQARQRAEAVADAVLPAW